MVLASLFLRPIHNLHSTFGFLHPLKLSSILMQVSISTHFLFHFIYALCWHFIQLLQILVRTGSFSLLINLKHFSYPFSLCFIYSFKLVLCQANEVGGEDFGNPHAERGDTNKGLTDKRSTRYKNDLTKVRHDNLSTRQD